MEGSDGGAAPVQAPEKAAPAQAPEKEDLPAEVDAPEKEDLPAEGDAPALEKGDEPVQNADIPALEKGDEPEQGLKREVPAKGDMICDACKSQTDGEVSFYFCDDEEGGCGWGFCNTCFAKSNDDDIPLGQDHAAIFKLIVKGCKNKCRGAGVRFKKSVLVTSIKGFAKDLHSFHGEVRKPEPGVLECPACKTARHLVTAGEAKEAAKPKREKRKKRARPAPAAGALKPPPEKRARRTARARAAPPLPDFPGKAAVPKKRKRKKSISGEPESESEVSSDEEEPTDAPRKRKPAKAKASNGKRAGAANRRSRSGYRGVIPSGAKWLARYKTKGLGTYPSRVEAALKYDESVIADVGREAAQKKLNFPEGADIPAIPDSDEPMVKRPRKGRRQNSFVSAKPKGPAMPEHPEAKKMTQEFIAEFRQLEDKFTSNMEQINEQPPAELKQIQALFFALEGKL